MVEEGNLTRAAARLYISRPALTKQIRQLEAQLGVSPFVRSRVGDDPTEAGEAPAAHAGAVLTGRDNALRVTRAATTDRCSDPTEPAGSGCWCPLARLRG
ncbi:LysR family transcriptional regulator [Embleya sp. MST-111070]|uniref:LysR family transcriptional regulator n=1 Tax=Embleya sp. MST-111070 TaxID=3398231 RepID=UPI003F732A05